MRLLRSVQVLLIAAACLPACLPAAPPAPKEPKPMTAPHAREAADLTATKQALTARLDAMERDLRSLAGV